MPTQAEHTHPLFARVYSAVAALGERGRIGQIRADLLAGATGRLLIVGLGPGVDLDHVPTVVQQVIAVEPSAAMTVRTSARMDRLRRRGVATGLVGAVAEALPLPDDSVDAVLCAFVLCSVDDPARALSEVRRVLRPGGRLLLLEHVRAPAGSVLERVQVAVAPAWRKLAGGCSPARDTRAAVVAAGFDESALRDVRLVNVPPCIWHLVGPAGRRGDGRLAG